MTIGEFLLLSVIWIAIHSFAEFAARAAAEGRSWMGAFASAGDDQVTWLIAL